MSLGVIELKWVLTKELEETTSIEEFEKRYQISFPQSYKEVVLEHNAGRPRPNIFDTEKAEERVVKGLLSFNEDDRETMWKTITNLKEKLPVRLIPIFSDPFGNYLCFNFDPLLDEAAIVFWEHETMTVEKVADSFEEFLGSLYKIT